MSDQHETESTGDDRRAFLKKMAAVGFASLVGGGIQNYLLVLEGAAESDFRGFRETYTEQENSLCHSMVVTASLLRRVALGP